MKNSNSKGNTLAIRSLGGLFSGFSGFFTSKKILSQKIREMEEEKNILEYQYEELNRLNKELSRTIKRLLAVQNMAKAILSVLDLDQLFSTIINILRDVCKANRIIMMMKNDNEGCLEYAHSMGFPHGIPERLKNHKFFLDEQSNILARIASTGTPELISDIRESALGEDREILSFGNNESLFIMPLISRLKVIGIMITCIDRSENTENVCEALQIFSPQIAIAIENAQFYSILQEQLKEQEESLAMLRRADKFAFLTNLSSKLANEIKEPFSSISKFIRMLPDNFDEEEFRDGFYNMALEGINRVNNLISELLSLVRSEESQYAMVDVHDLLEKTLLLISPHYKAKHIEIIRQYDPDIAFVWLDEEKMKQVFLNIISNAVDFSLPNGKIKISTRNLSENSDPDTLIIRIKDNGLGISKGIVNKIFDPYFSMKNEDGYIGNGGLGLFVALKNIQDHKGTIDVESSEGEGALFTIKVPVNSS